MNDDFDDYENNNPYSRRSEYLDKKREKRMARAIKTKDVYSLLENEDDEWDDDDRGRG
jgi:hypothetical protein